MKKKIPDQHFNELKNSGHCVPRDEKTGEPIPFKVGNTYVIENAATKETVNARCTQDCPWHLVLVK